MRSGSYNNYKVNSQIRIIESNDEVCSIYILFLLKEASIIIFSFLLSEALLNFKVLLGGGLLFLKLLLFREAFLHSMGR